MFHPFEAGSKFRGDILDDGTSMIEELPWIRNSRIALDEDEKIHIYVTTNSRALGQGAALEDPLDLPTETRVRSLQESEMETRTAGYIIHQMT